MTEFLVGFNTAALVALGTFQFVWNRRQLRLNDARAFAAASSSGIEAIHAAKLHALDTRCIRMHERIEGGHTRIDSLLDRIEGVVQHKDEEFT